MGAGIHGGFGGTVGSKPPEKHYRKRTIDDNAERMKKDYPLSPGGYFGEKGKNSRVIKSASPDSNFRKAASGPSTTSNFVSVGKEPRIKDSISSSCRMTPFIPFNPEKSSTSIFFVALDITINGLPKYAGYK